MSKLLDDDFKVNGPLSSDHRRRLRRFLLKLSRDLHIIPSSLCLSGVQCPTREAEHLGGGYADIFRGTYQGKEVALKRLRALHTADVNKQLVRGWQTSRVHHY